MAQVIIQNIKKLPKEHPTVHKPVGATYSTYTIENHPFFQIDTYGSNGRKMADKCSQSLQLDRDNTIQLIKLAMRELKISIEDLITA